MRTDYNLFSAYAYSKSAFTKEVDMFPMDIEIQQHVAELRAASEQYKLAQSVREKSTFWERLSARLHTRTPQEAQTVSRAQRFAQKDMESFCQATPANR